MPSTHFGHVSPLTLPDRFAVTVCSSPSRSALGVNQTSGVVYSIVGIVAADRGDRLADHGHEAPVAERKVGDDEVIHIT